MYRRRFQSGSAPQRDNRQASIQSSPRTSPSRRTSLSHAATPVAVVARRPPHFTFRRSTPRCVCRLPLRPGRPRVCACGRCVALLASLGPLAGRANRPTRRPVVCFRAPGEGCRVPGAECRACVCARRRPRVSHARTRWTDETALATRTGANDSTDRFARLQRCEMVSKCGVEWIRQLRPASLEIDMITSVEHVEFHVKVSGNSRHTAPARRTAVTPAYSVQHTRRCV